jgi:hypothetical protein
MRTDAVVAKRNRRPVSGLWRGGMDGFRGRAGARPRRRASSTVSARGGGAGGWKLAESVSTRTKRTHGSVSLSPSCLSLSFSSVPPGSLSPLKCSTPPAPVPPPTRRPVEFERPALSLPSTGGSDAGKAPAPRRTCRVLPACQFFLMPPLLLAAPD